MKVWAMTDFTTQVSSRPVRGGWLFLALVLGCAAPSAVWAQSMMGGGGHSPVGGAAPDKPKVAEPDSIPGAKAREPAAPALRPVGDMQPNDALFDAINRGDIAAARDALNRGAELNAVNILGMTPMELSVDLGRNDISFMLLSMRGEDSDRGSRAVGRDGAGKAPAGKTAAVAKAAPVAKPVKAARAADTPVATRPIATPKLFANDGGTPLPSAGFLGFDSRSASN